MGERPEFKSLNYDVVSRDDGRPHLNDLVLAVVPSVWHQKHTQQVKK